MGVLGERCVQGAGIPNDLRRSKPEKIINGIRNRIGRHENQGLVEAMSQWLSSRTLAIQKRAEKATKALGGWREMGEENKMEEVGPGRLEGSRVQCDDLGTFPCTYIHYASTSVRTLCLCCARTPSL
jgi:hypothetical protein